MNITFLERFQGKTSTVSKLGIQNTLRGPQDHSLIYTNTHKSFATVPSKHFRQIRQREDESKLSQKSDNQQELIERQTIHLPAIGERYMSHRNRDLDLSMRGQMRGQIDRQTNWIIDNDVRSTHPVQIAKIAEKQQQKQKENMLKVKKSTIKLEKRSSSSTKYERLGGLGANIGGEQWQIRRSKQQKALMYAQRLRRIKREKYQQSQQQVRPKINLRSIL